MRQTASRFASQIRRAKRLAAGTSGGTSIAGGFRLRTFLGHRQAVIIAG